MVLQGLHRVWPPIIALCQQLAAELGHPVQANAYVTPPQNQGFSNHYDVHDVFVLQIAGEKRWQIHAPVLESPLARPAVERPACRRGATGRSETPLIETVLRPGDCLYLPRGFLHAATALGGVSTHLTIGVHTWTRYALAEQLLSQALRDRGCTTRPYAVRCRWAWTSPSRRRYRADLELARTALVEALQRVDPDDQVARALQRSGARHPAGRSGRSAAPAARRRRPSTPDTVLRLRDHLAATLDHGGPRTVLRSRAGDFPLDEDRRRPGEGPAGLTATAPRRRPRSGPGPAAAAGRRGRGGVSGPPARRSGARRPPASASDPTAGSAPQARRLAAARTSRSVAGRRHRRRRHRSGDR